MSKDNKNNNSKPYTPNPKGKLPFGKGLIPKKKK